MNTGRKYRPVFFSVVDHKLKIHKCAGCIKFLLIQETKCSLLDIKSAA